MAQGKRLRKNNDRIIFGVCGALAEYFEMDPTIVRILFAVFGLMAFTGVIVYLVMALVIPSR